MRRSIYGETIQFRVPNGIGAALVRASQKDRTTVSEWLRREIIRKLRETGIDIDPDAGLTASAV
ncbi:MAG: hypothetical protein KF835_00270 [Xanthobacteraceae bacterium]|nr:hypothetical protein [Xanthobacteraceae bacterium]